MPAPTGPSSPILYASLYKSLPAIVKTFVMYYFTKSVYASAFFTGVLTATLFAGSYVLPKAMGGGTYYFQIGVPQPEAGQGLGFLVALVAIVVTAYYYRSRRAFSF